MSHRALALLISSAGFALFATACAAGASAAPYAVKLCTPNVGHEEISIETDPGTVGLVTEDECGIAPTSFEGIRQKASGPAGSVAEGAVRWTLNAPQGTSIKELQAIRESSQWNKDLVWTATNGSLPLLDKLETNAPGKDVDYAVNSALFSVTLQCAKEPCLPTVNNPFIAGVRLRKIVLTMDDLAAPTATIGPLSGGTPAHGTIQIPFTAHDQGAGVATATLFVDGAQKAAIADENSGRCTAPFRFLVPCKLDLASSFSFDTTTLPADGTHTLKVVVTDASGQTGEATATIEVRNAPSAVQRPTLTGGTRLGETLTGTNGSWDGEPATFAHQWLRCEPGVADGEEGGCTPIVNATQPSYVLSPEDVGRRLVVRVTATNAFGSASALSAPGAVVMGPNGGGGGGGNGNGGNAADKTSPVLTGVSLSRTRFRVGKARTALIASAAAARGTVLRFSSSEGGRLSIAISRVGSGATRPIATLARTISAGPGRVAFSGRVGKKPLRPGRYQLSVSVKDAAGNISTPARLSFKVLAG